MQRIITYLIFYLLSESLLGQNSIEGIISDNSNNEALPGVNVYIPELQKGTITNKEGYYEISNIPEGLFKIQYSFIGYKTCITTFGIDKNSRTFNISLSPATIQAQEVIVTGGKISTQHENAIKIEQIKSEVLQNSTETNLMEKLATLPGIDAVTKGNGMASPVIRGLSSTNIVLLNNGVRMENYQFSKNHPYIVDASDVSRIEIIKGPASLLYGSDAVGGVLNFIKEPPAPVNSIKGDFQTGYYSNYMGFTNNLGIKGSSENLFGGIRGYYSTSKDYSDGDMAVTQLKV
ncbi:Vitamin B12 transporter BtuB [subsurface metagenome]